MFKRLFGFFGKITEVGFHSNFYTFYNIASEHISSQTEALESVLMIYVSRSPFNILNDDDIKFLANQFAQFINCKKLLADVMWEAEIHRNARRLKDREFIEKLVSRLIESGEKLRN